MKKIQNSFYINWEQFLEDRKYEKINKFIKGNAWIIPAIYIIGTIILLFRNKIYGLPFASISIIQLSVLVVYLILFVSMFAIFEYNIIAFIETIKNNQEKNKGIKIIGTLIWHIVLIIIASIILVVIMGESRQLFFLLIFYYILYPIFTIIINKSDMITNFFAIVIYITLILQVPISMGGFKGQDVTYHSIDDNTNIEYTYFGNYEGLYQFIDKDKNIYLIPMDNGFITYKSNR